MIQVTTSLEGIDMDLKVGLMDQEVFLHDILIGPHMKFKRLFLLTDEFKSWGLAFINSS
jgi:hypothetical protein